MRLFYETNSYSQQRQFEKPSNIYPVLLAMEAQYHRERGEDVYWNDPIGVRNNSDDLLITKPEGINFLLLPKPDRVWTNAKKYTSGNYKYLPGTHIQVANGCWHGKCTFCVENNSRYQVRNVYNVIDEIKDCHRLGFKEIFDDSGTFPDGEWFLDFWKKVYVLPFNMKFGCNLRINSKVNFDMMKSIGFRMVLFGVESANQSTLDKIQKGIRADEIIPTIKRASKAGLEPHVSVMFGYPYETDEEAERTLTLVHFLLKKGYAKTAQSSFFNQEGVRSRVSHKSFVRRIYDVAYSPSFWFNQIRDIKDASDIKYLWRKIKTGLKEWR